ncbi:MAG: hypothetical protein C4523_14600 [Myxococcales bacterium]|nr:MAG: hypothetical protein C4523_14600 [Myxococcales bacterium]
MGAGRRSRPQRRAGAAQQPRVPLRPRRPAARAGGSRAMNAIHFILIFALIANAVANILIKEGMKAKTIVLSDPAGAFKAILFNPTLLAGVVCFGLALAAYSVVLSKIKLSVAYPIMTSAGFLIVVSYSFFKLQEQITALQAAGLVLILAGVWMVATNL